MAIRVTNAQGERPVMWLYEDIGSIFGGVSADEFRQVLGTIPAKTAIDLRINSGGGIFTEAIAMYTNLRQRKAPVYVYVDGIAASGASIIAMAGKTIEMAEGSWMMIHEAHALGEGRAEDLRKAAERLEAMNSQLVSIYTGRWKGDEDELRAALAAETWLTESETVERGLADSVSKSLAAAARVDAEKFQYKAAPEKLIRGVYPERESCAAGLADLDEIIKAKELIASC